MKKKTVKKLVLAKETVKYLESDNLQGVQGAQAPPISLTCELFGC